MQTSHRVALALFGSLALGACSGTIDGGKASAGAATVGAGGDSGGVGGSGSSASKGGGASGSTRGTGGSGNGSSASGGGGTTAGASGAGVLVPPEPLPVGEGVGKSGMRRLTIAELDNTLMDLLGDDTRPAKQTLQEEQLGPFDNDYTKLTASSVLIEGLERLAGDVTTRLLADTKRRDAVVGCKPTDPKRVDAPCLDSFLTTFGRRALRRPVTKSELGALEDLAVPFIQRAGDFYAGVEVALRALLQHPEFLYRVELGTPVSGEPGVFALNDFEIATRLSYTLWGSTPSDALLDLADEGKLHTPDDVRQAALAMFSSPRTVAELDEFHALWLGYSVLPHSQALTTSMRRESEKLIERTFENDESWLDIFTSSDTYVDTTLAELYGLPAPPGGEGWVSYGDTGRQGLLSQGSFLSILQDTVDTSPTRRGKRVRTQLLCQDIPPPPPNVNADAPPAGQASECKWDRYAAHRAPSTCASCHDQMDPIGFGLENFDREGRYRTHDIDTLDGSPTFGEELPDCEIAGDGEVAGVGTFHGPAELADLLIDNDLLGPCAATQFYRFARGRTEDGDDTAAIDDLKARFKASDYNFHELILGYVTSTPFFYRREEP